MHQSNTGFHVSAAAYLFVRCKLHRYEWIWSFRISQTEINKMLNWCSNQRLTRNSNFNFDRSCVCGIGYLYNSATNSCDDVNECDSNNGLCDYLCSNTDGWLFCFESGGADRFCVSRFRSITVSLRFRIQNV